MRSRPLKWPGAGARSEVVETRNKGIRTPRNGHGHDLQEKRNDYMGALVKPDVRASIMKVGADPAGGSSAEFGQFLNSQVAYWAKVVMEPGINWGDSVEKVRRRSRSNFSRVMCAISE